MAASLLAITAVTLTFTLSPGTSFTLTLAHVFNGDSKAPLKIGVGTTAGIALMASTLALTGFGDFVNGNTAARVAFAAAGTVVLTAIGVMMIVNSFKAPTANGDAQSPRRDRLVMLAFFAVVTNPKALGIYVLVVPTLSTASVNGATLYALFAVIHSALMMGWLIVVGFAAERIPGVASSPAVRKVILAIAGVAMIGIGAATAVNAV